MSQAIGRISGGIVWLLMQASSLAFTQPTVGAMQLEKPTGVFEFRDAAVRGGTMTVRYCRPPTLHRNTRVIFVMHGSDPKTVEQACGLAEPYVTRLDAIVVAPQFAGDAYPGDSYMFAGMVDGNGTATQKSQWGIAVIEHLFDALRRDLMLTAGSYDIVGFSGGGQFVHRAVLCSPDARFRRAIAGSPSRYMLPTFSVRFPYGLDQAPVQTCDLARALGREFILLLGDADTVDRVREDEAVTQGSNRFARGLRFFAIATEEASKLGAALRWQLRIVHGVGHDPVAMVRAALDLL